MNFKSRKRKEIKMKIIKTTIIILLIPFWLVLFVVYLPVWYIQMSWYYFDMEDYQEAYLILIRRIQKKLSFL